MDVQKLIKKYEKENKGILNRRPDLDMQGDFTPDGIKLFCNNGFIDDLRELAKHSSVTQANELLPHVSQQREQLAAFYEHLYDKDEPLRYGNGYEEADDFIAANCG